MPKRIQFLLFSLVGAIFLMCGNFALAQQASAPAVDSHASSIAAAPAAAGDVGPDGLPPQPTFAEILIRMLPMFLVVFLIFYLMVLKPQEMKVKTQQTLVSSLKRGETVITSSGIVGRVAAIEKDYIMLEVAPNVKLRFEPSAITKRPGDSSDTTTDKSDKKASAAGQ